MYVHIWILSLSIYLYISLSLSIYIYICACIPLLQGRPEGGSVRREPPPNPPLPAAGCPDIYIYIYIYIWQYIYIYICIYIYIYMYTPYIYIYIYIHICMHVWQSDCLAAWLNVATESKSRAACLECKCYVHGHRNRVSCTCPLAHAFSRRTWLPAVVCSPSCSAAFTPCCLSTPYYYYYYYYYDYYYYYYYYYYLCSACLAAWRQKCSIFCPLQARATHSKQASERASKQATRFLQKGNETCFCYYY